MALAFAGMLICELAVFGMAASFLLSFFGLSGGMMPALFAVLLSGVLCYGLKDRRSAAIRLIPLLLCALCALFVHTAADVLFIIPPCAYIGYMCVKGGFRFSYGDMHDLFNLVTKLMPVYIVFSLAVIGFEGFSRFCLPYLFMFLICSVMSLRMLRHDEETFKRPGFIVFNSVTILLTCLFSLLFSSDIFLNGAKELAFVIYSYMIAPILMAIGFLFAAVVVALGWLVSLFKVWHVINVQEEADITTGSGLLGFEDIETIGTPELLKSLGIMLLIAAFLYISFRLFKLVKHRYAQSAGGAAADVSVLRLGQASAPRPALSLRVSPVESIRGVYRRFLKRAASKGAVINNKMTTKEINNMSDRIFDAGRLNALREVYIEARYNESATKEDLKTARKIYNEIKKGD